MFAPVARLDTVCAILSLVYQLDVKSAFLHGELNEEMFIVQPLGYEQKGHEHKVYKLKKAYTVLNRLLEPGTAALSPIS